MTDILITGNGGKVDEAVAKSLESHGIHTAAIADPYARKNAPGYLRAVKKALEETGASTVLPIFFPEILSSHAAEFPGIRIMADTPEHILLLDDKVRACDLAEKLGIPQPERYSSPAEIQEYPVVFKRTFGQGGDSVYFPGSKEALEKLCRASGEHLITGFIDGWNICTDAIRWDGFFEARSYRVLEPSGKGVSTKRQSISCPEIEEYARRMLDAVQYKGVCGMDFRVEASTGKILFLECNPRFSGGIETTIESGLDLPWLYWQFFAKTCQ